MLGKLLLFPVTGPLKGMVSLAEKIAEQVNLEIMDKGKVTKELLELQVQLDLGRISEAEYAEREKELLEKLEEITAMEREEEV